MNIHCRRQILYFLKGAPGSGKTTIAQQLVGDDSVYEADKFPGWWVTGEYKYILDKALIKQSHEYCQSQVDEAMASGKTPIAVSNNSTEQRDWAPYIQLAKKHGYTCFFINCDGILLPDGTTPNDVHGVPIGVKLSRITKQKRFVAPIRKQWNPYRDKDESKPKLVIFDRDNTLVTTPGSDIPDIKKGFNMVTGAVDYARKAKDMGCIIAVASNNAGITFSTTGTPHKTEDELFLEAQLIDKWISPNIQLYCPDINGEQCWIFHQNLDKFLKINRKDKLGWMQSFRKPGAGMLEYIMTHFEGQFGDIEFIGDDDEKDKLAAQSAGIPFKHVWEIVRNNNP